MQEGGSFQDGVPRWQLGTQPYFVDFSLGLRVQVPDPSRTQLRGQNTLPQAVPCYQVQPSGLPSLDLPYPAPPLSHWGKSYFKKKEEKMGFLENPKSL